MIRRASLLLVLVGLLASGACNKEESAPQTVPTDTAAPTAAPVAADPVPAPTEPAAPAGSAAAAGTDTPQPQAGAAKGGGGPSIEGCCRALRSMANFSGKSQDAKNKAGTAGTLCQGMVDDVKSGKIPKSRAMMTIKGTLRGVEAPGECN